MFKKNISKKNFQKLKKGYALLFSNNYQPTSTINWASWAKLVKYADWLVTQNV